MCAAFGDASGERDSTRFYFIYMKNYPKLGAFENFL